MKQLAVEAVGHLYLILKSRRCIIKSRKKHGFPAQKALELWESHASFFISQKPPDSFLRAFSLSIMIYRPVRNKAKYGQIWSLGSPICS